MPTRRRLLALAATVLVVSVATAWWATTARPADPPASLATAAARALPDAVATVSVDDTVHPGATVIAALTAGVASALIAFGVLRTTPAPLLQPLNPPAGPRRRGPPGR